MDEEEGDLEEGGPLHELLNVVAAVSRGPGCACTPTSEDAARLCSARRVCGTAYRRTPRSLSMYEMADRQIAVLA